MSAIRGTVVGTDIMSKQKLRRGGVIINLASALAFENFPGAPIYVSSNNGVVGFTKAWGVSDQKFYKIVKEQHFLSSQRMKTLFEVFFQNLYI